MECFPPGISLTAVPVKANQRFMPREIIQIDPIPLSEKAEGPFLQRNGRSSSPKVLFETLGCRLNQSESDLIGAGFSTAGFEVVREGGAADLCVINTCSVTEHAEAKCRGLIRRILKKNRETFIAVTGCYAQVGVEALRKIPGIDLIVGTEYKMDLPSLVQKALNGKKPAKSAAPMVFHTAKIGR